MSHVLGLNAKLKYRIGGVGSGAWVDLTNAKDVTLNLETEKADVTTRANNGWKAEVPTLKTASVDFSMVWDTEDEGFQAIRDAFINGEKIGIAVLDADDGEGLVADMGVDKFTRNEPLADVLTVDVTVSPTYSATAPEWVEDGVS